MRTHRPWNIILAVIPISIISLGFLLGLLGVVSTHALTGSQFNKSNIIADGVFFNKSSMSASQIQTFLNAKVPTCDTNGTKPYAGTTRATYGASKGYPAPYTCLKDYKQTIPSKSADSYCKGSINSGNKSAAQIIYDVAQACGVSPKVLIVLLQKEQSLITDDWPWSIQYRSATGFGCPDTAACDSQYYGFFNQVYSAARQYQRYIAQPDYFNYAKGRTSFVPYQANAPSCGGTNITMQNGATAALYNYTPYQPNTAALANLYGTGDSCSAYGNRNFWRLFTDWFGSTQTNTAYAWTLESAEAYIDPSRTMPFTSIISVSPGSSAYIRVKARNIGNETWTKNQVRLGTSGPRDHAGILHDDSWPYTTRPATLLEDSVPPGSVGTFEFILKTPGNSPGRYVEKLSLVAEGIAWFNDPGLSFTVYSVVPASVSSSSTILAPGASIQKGQILMSPEKQTVLALQNDGNLVLSTNFSNTWSSNTHGKQAKRLIMQTDGNLVLYGISGNALWHSRTNGNSGAYLSLQIDGNMVIYKSGVALWNNGTVQRPNNLQIINSTLRSGTLYIGQKIETIDRAYQLVLQSDGNLVLYSRDRVLWASYTQGKNASRLTMQSDGNLVLYTNDGKPVWHTRTNGIK